MVLAWHSGQLLFIIYLIIGVAFTIWLGKKNSITFDWKDPTEYLCLGIIILLWPLCLIFGTFRNTQED